MKYLFLLIFMMTSVVLMAANPVGSITSSGPLRLNGKAVPVTASSSLPVLAGDEIVTSSSVATIFFADKSRATIQPNSRVKLEVQKSSVVLRVLSGAVDLKRAAGSRVSIIEPIRRATPNTVIGRVSAQPVTPLSQDPKPPPRSKHCPPDKDCN